MVRKSVARSIRQELKCANCNANCHQQLSFTDRLPEWIYRSINDDNKIPKQEDSEFVTNGLPPDKKKSMERSYLIRRRCRESTTPRHSEVPKDKKACITVFDALLKVFDLHWKSQKRLLRSTKIRKENLGLCNSCGCILSQVYDGLHRFTKLTSDAKPKSYLHPLVFPEVSNPIKDELEDEVPVDNREYKTCYDGQDEKFLHGYYRIDEENNPDVAEGIKVEPGMLELRLELTAVDFDVANLSANSNREKLVKPKRSRATRLKPKRPRETEEEENEAEQTSVLTEPEIGNKQESMPSSDQYPCIVCKQEFASKNDLENHCSTKHIPSVRIRSFECDDCGKGFITRRDLRHHTAIHNIATVVSCDKCPFKTRRQIDLDRHLKLIHLQEKSHICCDCGKAFVLKWQLADHLRLHNEERNYPCTHPGCGKTFKTPSNLRQHRELHRDSKYVCDICGQSYSRKAYLRLHMNGTHLMLPLPPSLKRKRDRKLPLSSLLKPPRAKSSVKRDRKSNFVEKCITIQDLRIDEEIITESAPCTSEVSQTVSEVDIRDYYIQKPTDEMESFPSSVMELSSPTHINQNDDTLHVRLDLDSTDRDSMLVSQGTVQEVSNPDPNSFTIAEGHQIICYPVGMNIISSENGDTYYIATTASTQQAHSSTTPVDEPDGTPITVYSSFTDFLSSQNQHQV